MNNEVNTHLNYSLSDTASMSLKANLTRLMLECGENPHSLHLKTGIPQPTIYRIAEGETSDPRRATVAKLAKFFGVTLDDMYSTNPVHGLPPSAPPPPQALPPDEQALLASFRALGAKDRARTLLDLEYKARLAALEAEADPPPIAKKA